MSRVVVKRSYTSTLQRAAIWKALLDEFRRRKVERHSFGRGRYLKLIYRTLLEHSDALVFEDGQPFRLNLEAVSESDVRDVLRRDLQPWERWNTDDQKLQIYHAFLQLTPMGGLLPGDMVVRYDEAEARLWKKLGYLAGSWQAEGAKSIISDVRPLWLGTLDLRAFGLELSEDYECSLQFIEGEPFDGPNAKLHAFSRRNTIRTVFVPNTVICFGDLTDKGLRPVVLLVYPIRGILHHEWAVEDIKKLLWWSPADRNNTDQISLNMGVHGFIEKSEPLVFGGMAGTEFSNLEDDFTVPRFRDTIKADELNELRSNRAGVFPFHKPIGADRLLGNMIGIEQSIEASLRLELFGANNEFSFDARMEFCGHPVPLVNHVFYKLGVGIVCGRVVPPDNATESPGRMFDPPRVEFNKLDDGNWSVYDNLKAYAADYGLLMPAKDPRGQVWWEGFQQLL